MHIIHQSAEKEPRELRLSLGFARSDLELEYSLIGIIVKLKDCATGGAPGGPALPKCVVRVALPPRTQLRDLRVSSRQSERIGEVGLPIAPLQPSRPGSVSGREGPCTTAYSRPGEGERVYGGQGGGPQDGERPPVERFPSPPFVLAKPELYAEAIERPSARLLQTAMEGPTPVATVELSPVGLTADGNLEFRGEIDLCLRYEPAETQQSPLEGIISRAQAQRQVALTRRTVINPERVFDFSKDYPVLHQWTDYLVITDNQRWDAQSMTAIGPAGGDLVASFQRLVAWKKQRGLRVKLVTISDIIGNVHGDFRTGSRDLQEVIRNFLKMAVKKWGVAWVLLGGDTNIVPIRHVAGAREGHIARKTVTPPEKNTSYWTGSHLRIYAHSPGGWWNASADNLLVRPDTGLLIPYDAAGTSNATTRGWFFTTDNTYGTRSTTATDYVRVNGPAAEVNADLQFLYTWNLIPTDLYYSSLLGPGYNQPGQHDWDLLNNGVYGQHAAASELDGINYTPSVSLGRAPVQTAAHVDAFVDKVIAYEKFERPDGSALENSWISRVVLASSNWGGRKWIGPTGPTPPIGNDQYLHVAGQNHTVIKLSEMPDWNWSLLAYLSESDVRVLPYRTDAASSGRGWYFATGSDDLSPYGLQFPLPNGQLVDIPLPSEWIAVYGPAEELKPSGYILNNVQLDLSLSDQEQLRLQMRSEMPAYNLIQRLYEDREDMTPAQVAEAPVQILTENTLRDALNAGPHIVSLSGHGNAGGCCNLGYGMADHLSNGFETFIAYADSCLTNQLDGDAVSEHLLRNANGGAVAYIGNTRFSWISVGDDFQRRFFHEWKQLGGDAHLGLLCDTRAQLLNSIWWEDDHWAVFSLNLLGDPEMPLWWREPLRIRIPELEAMPTLIFDPPLPPDPEIDIPYLNNWSLTTVHLQQGENERLLVAGPDGRVELPIREFQEGLTTLSITRAGHKPEVRQVRLGQPARPKSWWILWLLVVVLVVVVVLLLVLRA
jgi:hypothetical protein